MDRKSLGMAVDQTLYLMEKYPGAIILCDHTRHTMIALTSDGVEHTVIDGVDLIMPKTEPCDIAVKQSIYATNFSSDTVSVIDGTTNLVTDTITVGNQ